ncbi:MAG: ABC transporter ATP-binding protein, partial [Thermovirgaceae bacterium]
MKAVLEVSGINKFFGGVHAVRDLDFTLPEGILAGLIGPNGAGKTTVFNLITGIYPTDTGHIVFKGQDISNLKSYEVISLGIARTFQNLRLFQRSSALENVMTACQQHHHYHYTFFEAATHLGRWKRTERDIRIRSMELLDLVGLADRAHQASGTLPYGYQRRLEIARALALDPELLLLDEPAAGMNPEEVLELNDLIRKIHEEFKLTILVIEHHMELVMEICPRVICMNFGAKIAEGGPESIQNH